MSGKSINETSDTERSFCCSACGQSHDGTHHCPDPPDGEPVFRQTKPGFETVDSLDEAREVVDSLEYEKTMLKTVTQGDGFIAGNCDIARLYNKGYDRGEPVQVEVPLIGRVHWVTEETIAEELYEKQLPYNIVEWEDRFA